MNTEKYPDVEFQWQDGAWYDVSVRLVDSCLHVHYQGFSNDHDEILKPEEFKSGEDVRSKFRLRSQQLQDKNCVQVNVGMCICASCSSDGCDNKFFDAVVKHVICNRHIIVDGEEQCKCKFWVLWLAGPYAKKKKYVGTKNICLLNTDSNIEIHPALQSFLKLVEAANLYSGTSVHVDRKNATRNAKDNSDSAKFIHKSLKLGNEAIALSPYSGNTSSKAGVIPEDNGKEAPAVAENIAEKIMTVEEKMDFRTHVQRKYPFRRKRSTKEGSDSPSLIHKKLKPGTEAISLSPYSGNTTSKPGVIPEDNGKEAQAGAENIMTVEEKMDSRTYVERKYHLRKKRNTKKGSDSPSFIHKQLKPGTEVISLSPYSGNTSFRKDGNQYHLRRKGSTKEGSDSPSSIHKKFKPGTEAISLSPSSGNTSSKKYGNQYHLRRKRSTKEGSDSLSLRHKKLKHCTEAISLSPYSGNTSSKKDGNQYHLRRKGSTKEGSDSPSLIYKNLKPGTETISLPPSSGNTSSKKDGNQDNLRRKRSTKEGSDSPSLIHKRLKPATEAISLPPCSGNTGSTKDRNHNLSNLTSLPIQLDDKPEVTPENNRNEDVCDAEKSMPECNLQETDIGLERREGSHNLSNSASLPIQLDDSVQNIFLPIEWNHTVAVVAYGNRDNGCLEAQEGKQLFSSEFQCRDNVAIVENTKNCNGWLDSEDEDNVAIVENVRSGSGCLEAEDEHDVAIVENVKSSGRGCLEFEDEGDHTVAVLANGNSCNGCLKAQESTEFQCCDNVAIVEKVKNSSGWLEAEDEDDAAIVENVKNSSGWLEAEDEDDAAIVENVKNCGGWLESDSESEDEGQFSSSELLVLDNLENDISPDDIVSVLSNVTLGIVKVVIFPVLEPKKWANGLIWFKDHQSLLKAYAFLENDNFLTVSSNGRPWVVLFPEDEDGVYEDIFGSLNTMASMNTKSTSEKKIFFVNKGSAAYENAKAKKHLAILNNKLEHD